MGCGAEAETFKNEDGGATGNATGSMQTCMSSRARNDGASKQKRDCESCAFCCGARGGTVRARSSSDDGARMRRGVGQSAAFACCSLHSAASAAAAMTAAAAAAGLVDTCCGAGHRCIGGSPSAKPRRRYGGRARRRALRGRRTLRRTRWRRRRSCAALHQQQLLLLDPGSSPAVARGCMRAWVGPPSQTPGRRYGGRRTGEASTYYDCV